MYDYIVYKKKIGSNNVVKFSEVQTNIPISDILFVEGHGIFYTSGNTIGCVSGNSENGMSNLNADGIHNGFGLLSGLCYCSKNKCIFVVEDGGRNIRSLNINNSETLLLMQGQTKINMETQLRNTPLESIVSVSCDEKCRIFIAHPILRKCFSFCNVNFRHIAGDGRCRFSNGTSPICSSIGCPSGIVSHGGGVIISDSFSGVIRMYKNNGLSMLCGHPKHEILKKPSKLLVQRKLLFIQCDNGINMFSFVNSKLGQIPIYESNNIINMTCDDDKTLYVMEKMYA